ncbi:MAG: 2-oxoglutarate dehydrogenase, E2 component, dihydrolipoamide succinyltransferase, partial [Actinomycetota bacterium]|nr:2-oxoglutarate dehydrogenase, E2 component, dihydrolipoamide succinyltransferase [Actinomycetota bacterium]
MGFSVTMPALGESVSEGTVTRWLKQEGEQVEVDEPLLEVSTDKVDTEIPSPAAGVLQRIVVQEDATVEVGAELAVIGDGAEAGGGSGGAPAAEQQEPAQAPAPTEQPAPEEPEPGVGEGTAPYGGAPGGVSAPSEQPATLDPVHEQEQAGQQSQAPQQDGQAGASSGSGTPVTMPALGESVSEGTVTRWLKKEGEQVEADEPLLEVSTDKVDTEIPSPASGTLSSIKVQEDETVEVGVELATIDDGSGGGGAAPAAEEVPPAAEPQPEP